VASWLPALGERRAAEWPLKELRLEVLPATTQQAASDARRAHDVHRARGVRQLDLRDALRRPALRGAVTVRQPEESERPGAQRAAQARQPEVWVASDVPAGPLRAPDAQGQLPGALDAERLAARHAEPVRRLAAQEGSDVQREALRAAQARRQERRQKEPDAQQAAAPSVHLWVLPPARARPVPATSVLSYQMRERQQRRSA
jgi:hypothetical protein